MKLKDVWKKKEVTLSFEAFPPKKDSDFASVASAVEKIAQLKPDFMSVTYGAGRLNEKHYGALQGLNKSETASKYGEEQVLDRKSTRLNSSH